MERCGKVTTMHNKSKTFSMSDRHVFNTAMQQPTAPTDDLTSADAVNNKLYPSLRQFAIRPKRSRSVESNTSSEETVTRITRERRYRQKKKFL